MRDGLWFTRNAPAEQHESVKQQKTRIRGQRGCSGDSWHDTRALTRRIRNHGTMRGIISTQAMDPQEHVARAKNCPQISGQELVPTVATKEIYTVPGDGHRVLLIDFGAKANIVRCLNDRKCEVIVVPHYHNSKGSRGFSSQSTLSALQGIRRN